MGTAARPRAPILLKITLESRSHLRLVMATRARANHESDMANHKSQIANRKSQM
jgi:hypothetical protein